MTIDWLQIPDNEFEEVIGELLLSEGHKNVVLRRGGGDGGWDIEAEWVVKLANDKLATQPCRVECKRHAKSPAPEKIFHHYDRMKTDAPGSPLHLIFVAARTFSNPLKEDLRRRANEDQIILHIWEGEELTGLVLKHSSNQKLWRLLANAPNTIAHPNLDIEVFKKACSAQVNREITAKVGKKYIPGLYSPRPLEQALNEFLKSNLDYQQIVEIAEELEAVQASELLESKKRGEMRDLAKQIRARKTLDECQSLLVTARALISGEYRDKFDDSIKVVSAWRRNVFLVKDKAGSGKTNLLAHRARMLCDSNSTRQTAMFITCKLILNGPDSFERLILSSLREALKRPSLNESASIPPPGESELPFLIGNLLNTANAELVIFIDGINENRDISLLDKCLQRLFGNWNALPIKFVVTCRDIFWNFFSGEEWRMFFYRKTLFELPAFEEGVIDKVIAAYFAAFEIKGAVSGAAKERCRHPLLLRFFCEAYTGREIGLVEDVRLHTLFETYWSRKRTEIATALQGEGAGDTKVEQFIMRMAGAMMENKSNSLGLFAVGNVTGQEDLDSRASVYKRLLDEDIILEELPPAASMDRTYLARRVSFVYDEFYDFVLAVSFVRENEWDSKPLNKILSDFLRLIRQSDDFEQLRGVAVYLVLFSERRNLHVPMCDLLGRCGRHELLINILPKLESSADCAQQVLLTCMKSIEKFSRQGNIRDVDYNRLYTEAAEQLQRDNQN